MRKKNNNDLLKITLETTARSNALRKEGKRDKYLNEFWEDSRIAELVNYVRKNYAGEEREEIGETVAGAFNGYIFLRLL